MALQAIRGMNDILPKEVSLWQKLEALLKQIATSYGYQEIRTPILEKTELFCRAVGEVTDIVEKEMYTFVDRNNEQLSLRPEGTASCVRAGIEHGLFYNQTQRLWYLGPMFRHERPQKGRYRQFYHFGVEAFGFSGPDIDAELILLTARLWQELGLEQIIKLQINTLGSSESRRTYREALVKYLSHYQTELDADSQRRLQTNPLRVLDSKDPKIQQILQAAPQLKDYLSEDDKVHFSQLQQFLNEAGIQYEINPYLVRGLDYYNKTVFEWITTYLGAQGTVCAGGRYDGLVVQLGGQSTPAIGFALGLERLIALLTEYTDFFNETFSADIYFIYANEQAQQQGFLLADQIRRQLPLKVINHCGLASFKNQFKRADKSGAKIALVIGESELENKQVTIKWLREERDQVTIVRKEVVDYLAKGNW